MANSLAPTITPERVAEIRALLEKATPGPWFNGLWVGRCHLPHEHGRGMCKYVYSLATDDGAYWSRHVSAGTPKTHIDLIGSDEDGPILRKEEAALIVAAVNALPDLLSLAERATQAERELAQVTDENSCLIEQIALHEPSEVEKDMQRVMAVNNELLARATAAEATASRLRDALKNLYRGYVNTLEAGRDRIVERGGSCDPVDVMEAGDPYLIRARAALSPAPGQEG